MEIEDEDGFETFDDKLAKFKNLIKKFSENEQGLLTLNAFEVF